MEREKGVNPELNTNQGRKRIKLGKDKKHAIQILENEEFLISTNNYYNCVHSYNNDGN